MAITVFDFRDRIGSYKDEQQAHEAARDHSEAMGRPCTLEYPDGRYAETYEMRGGWGVGPLTLRMKSEDAQ